MRLLRALSCASRPLSRFLRLAWLERLLLWADQGPARRASTWAPRPSVRPLTEQLEWRETPLDVTGLIASGMAAGGTVLLSGQLQTPAQVVLQGWAGPLNRPPLAAAAASAGPARPSLFDGTAGAGQALPLRLPGPALPASTAPGAAPSFGGADALVQRAVGEQALVGSPWVDDVTDLLSQAQAPRPRRVTAADFEAPPKAGGGPGGSGTAGWSPSTSLGGGAGGSVSGPHSFGPAELNTSPSAGSGTASPALVQGGVVQQGGGTSPGPVTPTQQPDFGRAPLPFERNMGQADPQVTFQSQGPGFSLFLTAQDPVFAVPRPAAQGQDIVGRDVFRLHFAGGNASPEVLGQDPLPSRGNYFVGSDPTKWHTDVEQDGQVLYKGVYPGIDVLYHASTLDQRAFEFDLIAHPGANLAAIQMQWPGVDSVATDGQGRLLLLVGGRSLTLDAPVFSQGQAASKRLVQGSYVVQPDGSVGIQASGYDPSQDLVVDPTLSFSTYLGGSGDDKAYAVAVDQEGDTYVTGSTTSSDFPTANGFQAGNAGGGDAFVTKLNAAGNAVVYSTYLGGSIGADQGNGVGVDAAGDAWVVGSTASASSFPTTAGALQSGTSAAQNAFVTRLNGTGDALLYSSYLGNASASEADAVAVDAVGDAVVTGYTFSTGGFGSDFPTTTGAFQATRGGGSQDAFVTRFSPSGTLVYSSFLGGSGDDYGRGVALDRWGNAYVAGYTTSSNFPSAGTAPGPLTNGFVVKVNASGSALSYSRYLGGSISARAQAVAVSRDGQAYVTGSTDSTDFPTTAGAYRGSRAGMGGSDAFVTRLDSTGTVTYSTYLGGGTGNDEGRGIGVDANGNVSVAGMTSSSDFPTTSGAPQTSAGGGASDAFVTRLTPTGTLSYSSYMGGSGTDEANGLALDPLGNAYVAGDTNSSNFPTAGTPYQGSNQGGYDAFVSKVLPGPFAPTLTTISTDSGSSAADQITTYQNLTFQGTAPAGATVTLDRQGVGTIGTTTANGSGIWSFDYTGTTLAEGTYAFRAKATLAGVDSAYSAPDFLVNVDRTAPTVTLARDTGNDASLAPSFRITARDLIGVSPSATVSLDVDLNNDGNFTDPGEANQTTGTLTDGAALLRLSALSATGTYKVRARVTDLAGNEGTSPTLTFTVGSVTSPWAATAQVLTADPATGSAERQLGDVSISHALDVDQSPGTEQGGSPALVYHSDSVSVKPFVQVSLPSDNASSLPASIDMSLTLRNTAGATFTYSATGATVTYSTSGFSPGDVLTASLQAPTAITYTGRYAYSVLVKISGHADQTLTGTTYLVAQDSSPFGAGWTLSGVDRLISIPSDADGPAGVLRVYGSGGARFFQSAGGGSYTSGQDNGTITLSGGTYTYSTPDLQSETFDSAGYQAGWTSEDGKQTLSYRNDGSGKLTGVTAIDGALASISYSAGQVLLQAGSRTTTLTLSSGNLTLITDPDGGLHSLTYDTSAHLTRQQRGLVEANYAYTSAGTVGTITQGATTVNGVSNPSQSTATAAVLRGASSLVAGAVRGSSTDPLGNTTLYGLDAGGRTVDQIGSDGAFVSAVYCDCGCPLSSTDALGNTSSDAMDPSHYVTQVTNPDGTYRTYAYRSSDHALTAVTDERGKTTSYLYDASGHRTGMTDPTGARSTWTYDASTGLMTSETDPLGHTTSLQYDSARRQTVATDALGGSTSTTYDSNGNVQTVKDALGHTSTSLYDVMGRQTGTIDALGGQTTGTYDASGLQLSSTDQLGHLASLVYDDFGRGLLSKSLGAVSSPNTVSSLSQYDASGQATGSRNADGWWADTSYDPSGRASGSTDALGATTRAVYDLAGRQIASRDAEGNWSYTKYDQRGRVTSTTDAAGNVSSMGYDAAGNQTTATDPAGKVVTTVYDDAGRKTVSIDPLGHRTSTVYDAAGNVSTVTDPNGSVTSYAYDALNRQTTVTSAVGTGAQKVEVQSYDAVGNVLAKKDGDGKLWTYTYDALNRQVTARDPLSEVSSTSYDAVGNVTQTVDALGKDQDFGYDALNRQVASTDPLGNTTTTILDGVGATAASLASVSEVSLSIVDPVGRGAGSVDANGAVTQTPHDSAGGSLQVIDPVGNVTRTVTDALGREVVRIDPLGKATTTTYDSRGHVSTVTDRDGRKILYGYDDAARKTSETWLSSGGVTLNLLTFSYDAAGNQTAAQDSLGTVSTSYDAQGRETATTDVFGQTLTYGYDARGNVTSRQDSKNGLLTSTYDDAGRLSSRQFGGSGQTPVRIDFGYTARGQQSSVRWYSDLAGTATVAQSLFGYDDAGNTTSITNKDGTGATLSYYNYTFDSVNRVTSETHSSAVGTTTYSGTRTFTYDATSQLTSDGTTTYTYDGNGNRTMSGYQTGSANRLSTDGTYTYTYDSEGNLTQKAKGSGLETWTYAYDNRNRLTSVLETGTGGATLVLVSYTYDVLDRRVKQQKWTQATGTTTEERYAYDGQNVWADLDSGNSVTVRRIYGDGVDQLLSRTVVSGANAGVWAYATDRLGSVRDLIDWSGAVRDHLDYDGFGNLTESNASVGDRYEFTGRDSDKDTRLQFNRARYYDPKSGAWISEDPTGFQAGDMNLHRYAMNDPVSLSDPSGQDVYRRADSDGKPTDEWAIPANMKALKDAIQKDLDQYSKDHGNKKINDCDWLDVMRYLTGESSRRGPALNLEANRFPYTKTGGFLDLRHFFASASESARWWKPVWWVR